MRKSGFVTHVNSLSQFTSFSFYVTSRDKTQNQEDDSKFIKLLLVCALLKFLSY